MKTKIFFLIVSLLISLCSYSQITVTFNVDVQSLPVAAGGVHIAGNFVSDNAISIQEEWQPAAPGSEMALISGTTYGVDVTFPSTSEGDSLQFEFIRDNTWYGSLGDASEGNAGDCCLDISCAVEFGPTMFNRVIVIPQCGGTYNCVFNQCASIVPSPCDTLSFVCSNQNICEKFCVDFTDLSANNASSWQWDFPGGTPASSTAQSPSNICYDVPGIYDVTLTTTGSSGSQTLTMPDYIHVNATPAIPIITQNGFTLTSSPAAYYQWQLNAVDIPGATDQSYVVQQSGYYTVITSSESGCANSASVYISMVGIDEIENNFQLSVSPNPFSELTNINLQFSNREEVSLKIYDVQGRLIRTVANEVMSEGDHSFSWNGTDENSNEVTSGIYLLKIQTAEGSETIRLAVMK